MKETWKTEEGWMEEFKELGALWIHDENPKRPHACLTSGNHSNGFFNGTLVIQDPNVLQNTCKDLVVKIQEVQKELHFQPTWVIGPAFGAITIAHEVAKVLFVCRFGFTEPVVEDGEKKMILKRFSVEDQDVLLVEDVMTTGSTTIKTAQAVKEKGGKIVPAIGVLVNRSGMEYLDCGEGIGKLKIVALIDKPMPMWTPEECPLCKEGSEAIRPKRNWDKLNANY